MINTSQFIKDLEWQLRILLASQVLKKGFSGFWKYYLLAPFEGKHSENLRALSPDKAQTQNGSIYQISMTALGFYLLPFYP